MEENVKYVYNPDKVSSHLQQYLKPVVVDEDYTKECNEFGKPPDKVVYHSHRPTFSRIINKMKKAGVELSTPMYGFILNGTFHATPGFSRW